MQTVHRRPGPCDVSSSSMSRYCGAPSFTPDCPSTSLPKWRFVSAHWQGKNRTKWKRSQPHNMHHIHKPKCSPEEFTDQS
jgi:hypothetical protein